MSLHSAVFATLPITASIVFLITSITVTVLVSLSKETS